MVYNRSCFKIFKSKSFLYSAKISAVICISATAGWMLNRYQTEVVPLPSRIENSSKYLKNDFNFDFNFIADAAEKVMDSVVDIRVESTVDHDIKLFSSGSGIIIDNQGLILTNAHVLADLNEDGVITATTSEKEEFTATCFSIDLDSDLALLKISERSTPLNGWKIASLGSERKIRVGDWVVAIGSPMGLFHTASVGIVSATNRNSHEIGNHTSSIDFIQTDCNVHHGNSGGPLINVHGEVIGILTSRADVEGISFAIPICDVLSIIEYLKERKKIVRPVLGAKMISLSTTNKLKLSESHLFHPDQKGVLVTSIIGGSPANSADIHSGDIIYEINGHPVTNVHEITKKIGLNVNEDIKLSILRNKPFEQDWHGRTFTFLTEMKEVTVKSSDMISFHQLTKT